jgi:hypothetical protein
MPAAAPARDPAAVALDQAWKHAAARGLRLDAPVKSRRGWVALMTGTGTDSAVRFVGTGETSEEALADLMEQAPIPEITADRHCPTCTCEV